MKKSNGFTVIEILIALVIITAGFLPIYNLFKQGTANTLNNVQETIATNYASDLINFCKDLKYQDIKNELSSHSDTALKFYDAGNSENHREGQKIQEFFNYRNNVPPKIDKPFNRILILDEWDVNAEYQPSGSGLIGLFKRIVNTFMNWILKRKKVPCYIVEVTVFFPRSHGAAEDEVTLFSLILD